MTCGLFERRRPEPCERGRIAVILPNLRGGGAERVTLTLVEQFASMGFDVDLVVGGVHGELVAEVPKTVNLVNLATRRLRNLPLSLARYFRRTKPAAVLAVMQEVNCIAVLARRLSGIKCRLVLSEHNHASLHIGALPNKRGRWIMPKAIRCCYPLADHVVAVSEGVALDLEKNIGLRKADLSVIYNPVDINELTERSRSPVDHPWLSEAADIQVLVSVGSFKKQKDFATLIRAFAAMRSRRAVRLIILGEGVERPALEQLAHQLGVSDSISFPGFVDNPWAWMAKADVFVSSSRWEGFPMVLIEALALGLPIVATDCPSGPYEALDGGRFGQLVPVGDPRSLADAVGQALEAKHDRAEQIQRAEKYAPSEAAAKYLKLLGDPE